MKTNEKIFIITDGCMWELNKKMGTAHSHAMEVVDVETGAVRYIKSGSKIQFIEGEITDIRTQKAYNEQTMLRDGQNVPDRKVGKKKRGERK